MKILNALMTILFHLLILKRNMYKKNQFRSNNIYHERKKYSIIHQVHLVIDAASFTLGKNYSALLQAFDIV